MMWSRIAAAFVGVVFLLAGASKCVNQKQWRLDARSQGVWTPVAVCIPYVELVLGGCLVALPVSPIVLGLSTALLLIFTVFLGVQVAMGSKVPCACFGARSRRAPSWRDVLRNVGLMVLLFTAAILA